jgi:mRNA interferase RelE/StbE
MAYHIEIKSPAEKALKRLPDPWRRRITTAIDRLALDPRPPGCIKLTGSQSAYRIRIGDYRVVYEVVDRVLIVYVIRVAHRKDVYRRS